tara:strand:+ start:576 stop:827 length:252 start_codon:yes stop_codon:yes gene_type:complete
MKNYAIINLNDLEKVDFNQIIEGSENTIRKNIIEPPTQFIIKWSGETPSFISDGSVSTVGEIMNHEKAIALMATAEWSEPMPE